MLYFSAMFRRYLIGFILLALAEIGFGLTFVIGSVLTKRHGITPEVLSFCRFAIAGILMLALGCATPQGRAALRAPSRRDWLTFLWLGPIGTSIMAWSVFLGCSQVSVANASMADALTPLMIFTVATILARHITWGELLGLGSGFVGALLVVQIISRQGLVLEAYTRGDAFILLAAATWGIYTVCGRSSIQRLGSSVFTTWTMLAGAGLLTFALPFLPSVWPRHPKTWLLTLALAVISTLMPFWAWNAAQKYLPVSVISVSAYFAPVIAMGLAVMLLGEHVTPLQWLGTLFIVASATVETRRVTNRPKSRPSPHEQTEPVASTDGRNVV